MLKMLSPVTLTNLDKYEQMAYTHIEITSNTSTTSKIAQLIPRRIFKFWSKLIWIIRARLCARIRRTTARTLLPSRYIFYVACLLAAEICRTRRSSLHTHIACWLRIAARVYAVQHANVCDYFARRWETQFATVSCSSKNLVFILGSFVR